MCLLFAFSSCVIRVLFASYFRLLFHSHLARLPGKTERRGQNKKRGIDEKRQFFFYRAQPLSPLVPLLLGHHNRQFLASASVFFVPFLNRKWRAVTSSCGEAKVCVIPTCEGALVRHLRRAFTDNAQSADSAEDCKADLLRHLH